MQQEETASSYPTEELSERSRHFLTQFYPENTEVEWNSWRWQLQNRIKQLTDLEKIIHLSEDEKTAIMRHQGSLPLGITPYYLSLFDPDDATQGLRRTHIPVNAEYIKATGETIDPLHEDKDMVVPGLVHRYPDRVLFLVTSFCATYCRYCTRSRVVGSSGEYTFSTRQWEQAIHYIEEHPEIRDCLISGGDPLVMSDEKLDWLLSRLSAIPHLEFIRIGTKIPVVLPQRITPSLLNVLRKHQPLWMSIHFTHPDEITPEVKQVCNNLANAGVPLGSQTVLLQGINDSLPVLKKLFQSLLPIRVKPYYLYQCDPVLGTSHFKTPVEKGIELLKGLRGHTTGYAVPTYVIDAPGGGGKIPIQANYVLGREGDDIILENFAGEQFRYSDPTTMPEDKV